MLIRTFSSSNYKYIYSSDIPKYYYMFRTLKEEKNDINLKMK